MEHTHTFLVLHPFNIIIKLFYNISILAGHKFYHSKVQWIFCLQHFYTNTAPGCRCFCCLQLHAVYRFYNIKCEWTFRNEKKRLLAHTEQHLRVAKTCNIPSSLWKLFSYAIFVRRPSFLIRARAMEREIRLVRNDVVRLWMISDCTRFFILIKTKYKKQQSKRHQNTCDDSHKNRLQSAFYCGLILVEMRS